MRQIFTSVEKFWQERNKVTFVACCSKLQQTQRARELFHFWKKCKLFKLERARRYQRTRKVSLKKPFDENGAKLLGRGKKKRQTLVITATVNPEQSSSVISKVTSWSSCEHACVVACCGYRSCLRDVFEWMTAKRSLLRILTAGCTIDRTFSPICLEFLFTRLLYHILAQYSENGTIYWKIWRILIINPNINIYICKSDTWKSLDGRQRKRFFK